MAEWDVVSTTKAPSAEPSKADPWAVVQSSKVEEAKPTAETKPTDFKSDPWTVTNQVKKDSTYSIQDSHAAFKKAAGNFRFWDELQKAATSDINKSGGNFDSFVADQIVHESLPSNIVQGIYRLATGKATDKDKLYLQNLVSDAYDKRTQFDRNIAEGKAKDNIPEVFKEMKDNPGKATWGFIKSFITDPELVLLGEMGLQERAAVSAEKAVINKYSKSQTIGELEKTVAKAKFAAKAGVSIGEGAAAGATLEAGQQFKTGEYEPDRILEAAAVGTAFELPVHVAKLAKAPISKAIEKAKPAFEKGIQDIKMAISPISTGRPEQIGKVKEYLDLNEAATWQANQTIKEIQNKFTLDQMKKMGSAIQEEHSASVNGIKLEDNPNTKGKYGFSKLTDEEMKAVTEIRKYSDSVAKVAQSLGILDNPIELYLPRKYGKFLDDGTIESLQKEFPDVQFKDVVGPKTMDPTLLKRKYKTAEESQAAAKALFGEQVGLVNDIRLLPLATANLEKVIVGRKLIKDLNMLNKELGRGEAISTEKIDNDYVLAPDIPALTQRRPVYDKTTGKPLKHSDGTVVTEKVPMWVHKDLAGPMKAIFQSKNANAISKALGTLKEKFMSGIMISPLVHKTVIYSKAFPKHPLIVGTQIFTNKYAKLRQDKAFMRDAIEKGGLRTPGERGFVREFTDLPGYAKQEPGRSWTAQVLSAPVGLVSKQAADAVKRAVDRAGETVHQRWLWDKIADFQVGLYDTMSKDLIEKGMSPQAAKALAGRWANQFAGMIPSETMSQGARNTMNMLFFSRSFNITNAQLFKDAFVGLDSVTAGKIVNASNAIEKDLKMANNLARAHAWQSIAADVALTYVLNNALQVAWTAMSNSDTVDQQFKHYLNRFKRAFDDIGQKPVEHAIDYMMNPASFFTETLDAISPTGENEPGKERRINLGNIMGTGQNIYLKPATGKVGDDLIASLSLKGFPNEQLTLLKNKSSPVFQIGQEIWNNDQGFGKKVFDPTDKGIGGAVRNVGRIAELFVSKFSGVDLPFKGGVEAIKSAEGQPYDKLAVMKGAGSLIGFSVSKGHPQGEKGAILQAAKEHHDYEVKQVKGDIIDFINKSREARAKGDIAGAEENYQKAYELMQGVHMTRTEIKSLLRGAQRMAPGKGQRRAFATYGTPEDKEAIQQQEEKLKAIRGE
jgi:hypothetical protein